MNRIWYYVFRWYAVAIKLIARRGYDKWIVRAHKKAGVIILTHDWSFLKGLIAINKVNECISSFHALAYNGVSIGENSFIGAGAVILPGTKIGKFCIIGAGSVVKGNIPDYSIVVGNPCKIINDTRKFGEKFLVRSKES